MRAIAVEHTTQVTTTTCFQLPHCSSPAAHFTIPILSRIGAVAMLGFDRGVALPQPWFLLRLLRPAQDALLHVLVEDLLLVVAPHLRAQRETIDQCFEDINCVRYRRRTPMTHLGYNCIQRQGAVAAEKLDDDPASTRMGAGVRRNTLMCFGRQHHL